MVDWTYHLQVNAPIGMTKTADAGGYWRRIPAGHVGHDQAGNEISGKTWVKRTGMKAFFKPFPHQKSFIKKVLKLPPERGVIAAHGTGTGKTISAISAFEKLQEREPTKVRRALIVAPAGIRENFRSSVEKFTDSKAAIVPRPGTPIDPDTEYVVVSYSSFAKNYEQYIKDYEPDVLIADEVHRATNMNTKNFRALMEARNMVPRFFGLTASVVQNDPSDIVPLLQIANKGQNPKSLQSRGGFRRAYVGKVLTKQRGMFGGKTHEKVLKNQKHLRKYLDGNIHYLEDLDAEKKPKRVGEKVEVRMNKEQVDLYEEAMKGVDPKIRAKIEAGVEVSKKEAANIFTRILYARQVSNSLYPFVPKMSVQEAAEKTPKIKKILDDLQEHLKTTPDGKVVLYTNFVHGGVDVLSAGLEARGIPHGIFAGKSMKGISEEGRQEAVRRYKAGIDKVLIITSAGAEGLSLGNTTLVQLADGHYNPERISQAEARGIRAKGLAHRPKEKRQVRVKQYLTVKPPSFWRTITFRDQPKSVDQFVEMTAERKRSVNKKLREILKQETLDERTFLDRLFGA